MFKTLRNAFKIKEIRSSIIYTLLMLVVVRIGYTASDSGSKSKLFFGTGLQADPVQRFRISLMQLPAVLSRRCRYLH